MVFAENGVPYCPQCQNALKPGVVLFGELLPFESYGQAYDAAEQAELFICIGSSLLVEPVASLPRIAVANGAVLVIINRDPTPYHPQADLCLSGEISAELTGTLEALGTS